jgi:hypothetical protein
MKGLKSIILAVVIMVSISSIAYAEGSAPAEAPKLSGSASVDVMSRYVWRGMTLSNKFVVQPSIGITYEGFGANIWGNYDTDLSKSTEVDYTLSYNFSVDKLSLGVGYIYYALVGVPDTQEIYFSVGYDTILKPTLTYYQDIQEGKGGFLVASIGHSIELSKDVNLNLGASASYNFKNAVMGFDRNGNKFNNLYNAEVSASVNIPVSKAIVVTPKAAYSFALSNDAKDAISGFSVDGKKNIFYGGVNLTLSF